MGGLTSHVGVLGGTSNGVEDRGRGLSLSADPTPDFEGSPLEGNCF